MIRRPPISTRTDTLFPYPTLFRSWSSWLIGCVVVYGLLPRLVCLAVSLYLTKTRLAGLTLDTGLPGYAELRDRLAPVSENTGIDAAPTPAFESPIHRDGPGYPATNPPMPVGIELPADRP